MTPTTRMLSIVAAFAICAAPAFPVGPQKASATKQATPAAAKASNHVAQGTVVSMTSNELTIHTGKKDMTLKLNATSQKPATLTTGSKVTVHYRSENNENTVTSIQEKAGQKRGLETHNPQVTAVAAEIIRRVALPNTNQPEINLRFMQA